MSRSRIHRLLTRLSSERLSSANSRWCRGPVACAPGSHGLGGAKKKDTWVGLTPIRVQVSAALSSRNSVARLPGSLGWVTVEGGG